MRQLQTSLTNISDLQKAALGALALHLLLLSLVPNLPKWQLTEFDQGIWLNVFIYKEPPPSLDQSLNFDASQSEISTAPADSLEQANQNPGHLQEQQPAPQINNKHLDVSVSHAQGQHPHNRSKASVIFSHAAILKFAKQEAIRYADQHPREVALFNRSFHSKRRTHRRQRANSYKNQYGDQYVKNSSANGDICFVKTADSAHTKRGTLDQQTYTVHFFRCKQGDGELVGG